MLGFSCSGKPKEKAVLFSFRRRSSGRGVAPRLTTVRRWPAFLLCIVAICVGGGVAACVSAHAILSEVVKALEGSTPFHSFRSVDGLYVATGFVIVPLPDAIDDYTLLEATGHGVDQGGSRGGRSKGTDSCSKTRFWCHGL